MVGSLGNCSAMVVSCDILTCHVIVMWLYIVNKVWTMSCSFLHSCSWCLMYGFLPDAKLFISCDLSIIVKVEHQWYNSDIVVGNMVVVFNWGTPGYRSSI